MTKWILAILPALMMSLVGCSSNAPPEADGGSAGTEAEQTQLRPFDSIGGPSDEWDPDAAFTQRDADGDGKLTGDELSQWVADADANADGGVTREEFNQWRQSQPDDGGGTGTVADDPAP